MAFSNFLHVSFGVYLKHQALTDSFYQFKTDSKYEKLLDPNNRENLSTTKVTRNENILSMAQHLNNAPLGR